MRLHADLFVTLPAWLRRFTFARAGVGFVFVVVPLAADSLIFVFNMTYVSSLAKEPHSSSPSHFLIVCGCLWLLMAISMTILGLKH